MYFTVTHCFHPLYQQQFRLVEHRQNWGEDRVIYLTEAGELKSLPASWTSVLPEDPYITFSKWSAFFHVNYLLELTTLIEHLNQKLSLTGN